jgi:hypothetical protein
MITFHLLSENGRGITQVMIITSTYSASIQQIFGLFRLRVNSEIIVQAFAGFQRREIARPLYTREKATKGKQFWKN